MKKNFFILFAISLVIVLNFPTNIFAMKSQKNKPVLLIYNKKYGLLDNNLEVVVSPQYEKGFITADKNYVVLGKFKDLNYDFSVIDFNGNKLFSKETKFNGVKNISSEQLFFESLNKNEDNIIYIPSKDKIIPIKEKLYNIYSVTNSCESQNFIAAGKFYYDIEQQKKIFEDKEFIHVMPMLDSVAIVVDKNFKKKIIKKNGEIIFDDVINSGRYFAEGLLAVKGKNKSGFIDKSGKYVFECSIFPDGSDSPKGTPNLNCSFSEGLVYVQTKIDTWTLFSKDGKVIKENLQYYPTGNVYSDGYLLVYDKEENKLGFLNKKGEVEIPFILDEASSFVNGYANIIYDGKDALIDLEGNLFLCEDLLNNNKVSKFNLKHK